MEVPAHLLSFQVDVSNIELPEKFTFPFNYQPHPLVEIAAKELQDFIKQQDWRDILGEPTDYSEDITGKMFGVLVVKTPDNQLAYLAAFSGFLNQSNQYKHFVPPVFDLLESKNFFLKEEAKISAINKEIEKLELNPEYIKIKSEINSFKKESVKAIEAAKKELKAKRKERRLKRKESQHKLDEESYNKLLESLANESRKQRYDFKELQNQYKSKLSALEKKLNIYAEVIQGLKQKRREDSAELQERIFASYQFLNKAEKSKNLIEIFGETIFQKPPAGSGDCCAPKLLQYAFIHKLEPIAMGEFWWGAPPVNQLKKHLNYYPACSGKCKPILGHMLEGLEMDDNPLLKNKYSNLAVEIIYEDEYIILVDKPAGLLSVPGKEIEDSVYSRIKIKYPKATGPLLLHRLDMATSGLILIAKDADSHKFLQKQFMEQKVKKTYLAILENEPKGKSGTIRLPLSSDPLERPLQIVDFINGKASRTIWRKLMTKDNQHYVTLHPVTGRTHQLRVHCSHPKGLNNPIKGDELYGTVSDRLYLQAQALSFIHPATKQEVTFEIDADF